MKRLSNTQKKEALQNALVSFQFPKKYVIVTDQIKGNTFALGEVTKTKSTTGGAYNYENPLTGFMSYEELNAYLKGYYDSKMKKFN